MVYETRPSGPRIESRFFERYLYPSYGCKKGKNINTDNVRIHFSKTDSVTYPQLKHIAYTLTDFRNSFRESCRYSYPEIPSLTNTFLTSHYWTLFHRNEFLFSYDTDKIASTVDLPFRKQNWLLERPFTGALPTLKDVSILASS